MAITVLLAAIPGRQLAAFHVTNHLHTELLHCSQENTQNPQCCTPAAPNTPPGPQLLPTAVLPSCSLSYPPRSPVAINRCAAFLQPFIPPQVPGCYQPLCCLLAASHTPPGPQLLPTAVLPSCSLSYPPRSPGLSQYVVGPEHILCSLRSANRSQVSFQEAPYGAAARGQQCLQCQLHPGWRHVCGSGGAAAVTAPKFGVVCIWHLNCCCSGGRGQCMWSAAAGLPSANNSSHVAGNRSCKPGCDSGSCCRQRLDGGICWKLWHGACQQRSAMSVVGRKVAAFWQLGRKVVQRLSTAARKPRVGCGSCSARHKRGSVHVGCDDCGKVGRARCRCRVGWRRGEEGW
jgi:hypothetical protein